MFLHFDSDQGFHSHFMASLLKKGNTSRRKRAGPGGGLDLVPDTSAVSKMEGGEGLNFSVGEKMDSE
jgi:hypothetical protein